MSEEDEKTRDRELKMFNNRINILSEQIAELEVQKDKMFYEFEIWVDVLQNIGENYEELPNVRKQEVIRLLFSNLIIDNQKRLTLKVKP
jgi:hypothetical protein